MGCSGCSPQGCGDKGHCSTGSCNKMNTYDWINVMDLEDPSEFQFVEVSFKGGSRKEFFYNEPSNFCNTGEAVVVEAAAGYDIGSITLSGEMVRMQMKRKHTNEDRVMFKVIRRANERDLEKLDEARKLEYGTMVRARAIAQTLGLDMKLGDVEYQGDLKKATFFYTANGRVDFRELVREYAKEFRVKVEMRQIGSRQESARIGGIGSCGRELCCSTWLSDFRSVNTSAARYQNIAINQTKLSGQCGRLKCCLNYELDTYMDAVKHFPNRADHIMTKKGRASLMKTDIFKGLMYYSYDDVTMRGVFHPLDKERVKEILAMNSKGIHPEDLNSFVEVKHVEAEVGYEDVTGQIELPNERRKKKKSKSRPNDRRGDNNPNESRNTPKPQPQNRQENNTGADGAKEDTNQRDQRPDRNKQRDNRPQSQNRQENKSGADGNKDETNQRDQRPDRNKQRDNRPQQNRVNRPQSDATKQDGQNQDANQSDSGAARPEQQGQPRNNQNRNNQNKGPRPPRSEGERPNNGGNTSNVNGETAPKENLQSNNPSNPDLKNEGRNEKKPFKKKFKPRPKNNPNNNNQNPPTN